jgi:5-methylthioadenosine/S-adenosylhomocysteine deaminase
LNILNPKTVMAHCVHLSDNDIQMMREKSTPLVHCPSSNLKLGSGIAPIHYYHECGLLIGLGSDGAPCNNTMDLFKEIHLAALLQKPRFGSETMPAEKAFAMATIDGARVLGEEARIGSLEAGKQADIVMVDRSHPSVATVENPYSALVYSCSGRDVLHTMTAGRWTVFNRKCMWGKEARIIERAQSEKRALIRRAKKLIASVQ